MRMLVGVGLVALLLASPATITPPSSARASSGTGTVVINEIAWMVTTASYTAEWLELYNPGTQAVEITGWTLSDGGDITIALQGTIPA